MGSFLSLCFGRERRGAKDQQHTLLLDDEPSDSPGIHVLHPQSDSGGGLDFAQIQDMPDCEDVLHQNAPSPDQLSDLEHSPNDAALDRPSATTGRVSRSNSNPSRFGNNRVIEEEEDVSNLFDVGEDESSQESDVSDLEQQADQGHHQNPPEQIAQMPEPGKTDAARMLELIVNEAGHEGVNGTYRWFPLHKSYVLFHDAGQFQIKPTRKNWVLEEITEDGHVKLYAAPRNSGDLSTVVMTGWFSCGGMEPIPKFSQAKFNESADNSPDEPNWGEEAIFADFDLNDTQVIIENGMSEDEDASDISGMSS